MTENHKQILRATLDVIEDQIRSLDNEICRDSRALVMVNGLVFSEDSDSASLRFEMLARQTIENRIALHSEARLQWNALSDELYNELYHGDK